MHVEETCGSYPSEACPLVSVWEYCVIISQHSPWNIMARIYYGMATHFSCIRKMNVSLFLSAGNGRTVQVITHKYFATNCDKVSLVALSGEPYKEAVLK